MTRPEGSGYIARPVRAPRAAADAGRMGIARSAVAGSARCATRGERQAVDFRHQFL